MAARKQGKRLFQVGAQFLGSAGLAGMISGDGQTTAEFSAGLFKSADIIALPAVERNGNPGELAEGAPDVHTQFIVPFLRQREISFQIPDFHKYRAFLQFEPPVLWEATIII